MKYLIQINQLVLSKTKLDIKDCAILDYLKAWCQVDDKKVKQLEIKENEVSYRYTWINLKHLINEMPILGLKNKASISKKIQKIEKEGFIKTHLAPDRSLYVRLTEKIKELDFNEGVSYSKQGVSYSKHLGVSYSKQHKHNINSNNISVNNLNLIEVPKIDTSNSKGKKEKNSIPKDWQLEVIEEFKKWYKVKFKEDYLVKKEDYINVANLLKTVPKDQLLANVKKFIACDHHIPRRYGYTIGVFYKYYSNLVSTKFGIYA